MACEVIAEIEEPLSRQSLADLVRRSLTTLDKKISRFLRRVATIDGSPAF